MSSNPPNTRGTGVATAVGPKARGANRSTKIAGKLKVLPDQPEPVVPLDKEEPPPPPKRTPGQASVIVEDSDEDEGDDEATTTEDTEEIEVRCAVYFPSPTSTAERAFHPGVQSN